MTAAQLDLTSENGLAIEQGADYEFLIRLREQLRDEWQVDINAAGTDGDIFSVDVFGSASDRPELNAEAQYTKQPGDQPSDISTGLQAALLALTVTLQDDDTGEDYQEPLSNHIIVIDDGASFKVRARTKAQYLDLDVSGSTVPANITLTNTVDIQLDLTGASITVEIRRFQSSGDVLATWTEADFITIQAPATRGILMVEVPAATTSGYTFESAWWQMDISRPGPPLDDRRWFEGQVENRLSLLLQ